MSAVWFMMGVLTTLVAEIIMCIVYAISYSKKGGKK
jgi:hypothetical protein